MGFSHWVTRGPFLGQRQEFHHWAQWLNFDADVKNTTARHQCENRFAC